MRGAKNLEEFDQFLINSLTPYTIAEMFTCMEEGNIHNEALLYKCIINKSTFNNHKTTELLKEPLEGLPELIVSWYSEMTKCQLEFNE